MRNEHIVRARQAPETAINPFTGTPYRVFHVDNSVAGAGTGTAESPFATLSQAETAATAAFDIVYVHVGASATTPYITPVNGYSFTNTNQFLIGEGSSLRIPTLNCGPEALFAGANNGLYPVIRNPIGEAIAVDQAGSVVSHLRITGSPIGISDGTGLAAPGVATISDVIIEGGPGIPQRGVAISAPTSNGTFNFDRLQLVNLTNDGILQSAANSNVTVTNSRFSGIQGAGLLVSGAGARATVSRTAVDGTIGTAILASGSASGIVLTSSTISNTTGDAIVASGIQATVNATDFVTSGTTTGSALVASGSGASITGLRGLVATTGSDSAVVSGVNATMNLVATRIRGSSANGATVSGVGAEFYLTGTSAIENATVDGLRVTGDDATVLVQDSSIVGSGNNGATIQSTSGTTMQVTFLRSNIRQTAGFAVSAAGATGAAPLVQVFGSTISQAGVGISAVNSNLDVGRDPTRANGVATSIQNTGLAGVTVSGDSLVRVANTSITGVDIGILADNGDGSLVHAGTLTQLTATNNTINSGTAGISVVASGTSTTWPGSGVRANIASNRITTSGSAGIRLLTQNPVASPGSAGVVQISNAGGPGELGSVNFNTTVLETPVTAPTQVLYNSAAPLPPPQPVPLVPIVPALP